MFREMAEVASGSRDDIEHMRSLETEPSWPGNSHWFPHLGWNVETVGTIEFVHVGMDLKGGSRPDGAATAVQDVDPRLGLRSDTSFRASIVGS